MNKDIDIDDFYYNEDINEEQPPPDDFETNRDNEREENFKNATDNG